MTSEEITEPFSTEAEALATAIYEDNVNSWFEAKRMLVAALQSAYERGKQEAGAENELARKKAFIDDTNAGWEAGRTARNQEGEV